MNQEQAKNLLEFLFGQIGCKEALNRALKEECRNAYLHGLCDSAFSEWASAYEFVDKLCDENGWAPRDIEIWHLTTSFPEVIFREDEEIGFQFARGRLFSLRDYQEAKSAILALGEDKFEQDFKSRFGRLSPKYSHLWENV